MKSLFWQRALLAGLALVAMPLSAPLPAWAQAGGLLSLQDALSRAGVDAADRSQVENPRVQGPLADISAAESLIRQARLRPNPQLSFEAENLAGSGAYSGFRSSEYTLSLGLPVEWGGKRTARIRAAEADLEVARLRGSLALVDLGYLVRSRYVAATAAEARVDLARGIWERNRELARIAATLVEVGREPPLRALRAQAALAEAEAEVKSAMATALAARFALGALWGDETAPEVGARFPEIRPPYELLSDYDGLALKLASAETGAARAAIAQERSLAAPDPTFSAGVRRIEESGDEAFLVGVSIPLPFGNRNQGNIAAAEARARAAAAREHVARADYRQEVASARADFLAAQAKAETLEADSLPQADEALRLAELGYRNGKFPLIEVLAAAEARDAIRRSLIDAREDQGRAAAMLIRLAQP